MYNYDEMMNLELVESVLWYALPDTVEYFFEKSQITLLSARDYQTFKKWFSAEKLLNDLAEGVGLPTYKNEMPVQHRRDGFKPLRKLDIIENCKKLYKNPALDCFYTLEEDFYSSLILHVEDHIRRARFFVRT